MRTGRALGALLTVLVVSGLTVYGYTRVADRYQRDGIVTLPILKAPVRVVRDEQGIAYIYAESLDDAIRAQGWITAQDRGLQLEVTRYLSSGRLAEIVGEPGLKSDIEVRLAGTSRHGRRHAELLAGADRHFYETYLEGVNAYIGSRGAERQFGFRLLGIEPQPWTLADLMTLLYFLSWQSSVNWEAELVAQSLSDHLGARAAALRQVTINPDDDGSTGMETVQAAAAPFVGLQLADRWFDGGNKPWAIGSNQWVMSGNRSVGGAPMVVNDPHLDARMLPGTWHPIGLITPEFRAVGVAGPGIPGVAVGRTTHVAYGVTNAYADVVDLFIEREDPENPGNYLEGSLSYPFETVTETVRVRAIPGVNKFREIPLKIRFTHRGPIISDHDMVVAEGRLISLRWSAPEAMAPDMGVFALFTARSVADARAAVGRSTAPYNYVMADSTGNIGHATGGKVPRRLRGDGSFPVEITDGTDPWDGFIPAAEMPGQENPARGWVGNANHRTVSRDYSGPYSTYFAASWRYRRMLELLESQPRFTAADHWTFMLDTKNLMAVRIAPLMSAAFRSDDELRKLAEVLDTWDYQDDPSAAGPMVFQSVYRHFVRRVFEDDLGPELAARYLGSYYLWQERVALLLDEPDADWFDDRATPVRESRDDLFRLAARDALQELQPRLGKSVADWQWGKQHTITFFSPLIPGKRAAAILGWGTHPKEGSGETINRATFRFDQPYDATSIASMRVVIDLSDPDKIWGVLAGGASGRQFDPHLKDQSEAWLNGSPRYWWFSDQAIAEHQVSELSLEP